MFCHANGTLIYPVKSEYVRFEAEVGIDDASNTGSVFFHALNVLPTAAAKQLSEKYPDQIGMLNSQMGELDTWLVTVDASIEKQVVEGMANKLKDSAYFKDLIRQVAVEKDIDTQIRKYLELFEKIQNVYEVQSELEWLNIEAIKLAFADMKKQQGYDAAKYEPLFNELLSLSKKGFNAIYQNNAQALADARKGISMFTGEKINVPVLGLVENMSWFTPAELPENKYYLFGKEGGKRLAEELNIPLLGQIPIVQSICEGGDSGKPVALNPDSITGQAFQKLAENVVKQIDYRNEHLDPTKRVVVTKK